MFEWDFIKIALTVLLLADMNNVFLMFPHFVTKSERTFYWAVIIVLFAVF